MLFRTEKQQTCEIHVKRDYRPSKGPKTFPTGDNLFIGIHSGASDGMQEIKNKLECNSFLNI